MSSSPVYPLLAGDARHPPRGDQHDHRPADADQQPVASRSCWRARGARTSRGPRRPSHANVKSTAYSGSTAISASTVRARPWETSSWSTSAAQASRNAEPEDREAEEDRGHDVGELGARQPGEHARGRGQHRPDPWPERSPGARGGRSGCCRGPSASPSRILREYRFRPPMRRAHGRRPGKRPSAAKYGE